MNSSLNQHASTSDIPQRLSRRSRMKFTAFTMAILLAHLAVLGYAFFYWKNAMDAAHTIDARIAQVRLHQASLMRAIAETERELRPQKELIKNHETIKQRRDTIPASAVKSQFPQEQSGAMLQQAPTTQQAISEHAISLLCRVNRNPHSRSDIQANLLLISQARRFLKQAPRLLSVGVQLEAEIVSLTSYLQHEECDIPYQLQELTYEVALLHARQEYQEEGAGRELVYKSVSLHKARRKLRQAIRDARRGHAAADTEKYRLALVSLKHDYHVHFEEQPSFSSALRQLLKCDTSSEFPNRVVTLEKVMQQLNEFGRSVGA